MNLLKNRSKLVFTGLVFLMVLNGCYNKQKTNPIEMGALVQLTGDTFQFKGKVSFSDGQDGGSGSIHWQSQNGIVKAIVKAPLGSKSWQIVETMQGAELYGDNGRIYKGIDAQDLIQQQVGWAVPWEQLKQWVKGQKSNEDAQVVWSDNDEYFIIESGWHIAYSRLKKVYGGMLPHKIIAKKGQNSIKLVVREWDFE